ncbi:MAG TPA: phosphomannomutase/phosphoglucomutase [Candidatus Magasanikbacteria bacterium]|nr:phosphomannomutase/phosphoglucomutase [Candidatus Magasanikbacteria bacterium]
MSYPKHIFKAYDIRGLAESELSEELAWSVGNTFAYILEKKGVTLRERSLVVGYDMRGTSTIFAKKVIEGIQAYGVSVVDIGLTSTPVFNFACAHYPAHAGGIMVTASHNPAEYNGFKLTYENGLALGTGSGMEELRDLINANHREEKKEKGMYTKHNIVDEYIEYILSLVDITKIKPMKIVVDAGNGMASVSIPKLLERLPIEVEYLYLEPDGTFPNHEANPLKEETLRDLQKKVKENNADFGFALDGDADRIGLVDESGDVVPASFVGGLVGLEILKLHPGAHMFYDLRMSRSVKEAWEAHGATTEICKVGHANIKRMMKEKKAVFAAELSLHLFYQDTHDVESTDFSLLLTLLMLSTTDESLSARWKSLEKYSHSGEINFHVEHADAVIQKIRQRFSDAQISELDGVLFEYPEYWISVRKSNTEPVLRLNVEAHNKQKMSEIVEEIRGLIAL